MIRQIRPTEGEQLRAIRLQAIADSPSAFGSTLAETEALSAMAWEEFAARNAAGNKAVMFVAEDDGAWVGLAGGMLDPHASVKSVTLFSMWVAPSHRRKGFGRELVGRVTAWSRARGAERIALWVTQSNDAAIELYASCGFQATEETKPLPSNPTLLEQEMVQELARDETLTRPPPSP